MTPHDRDDGKMRDDDTSLTDQDYDDQGIEELKDHKNAQKEIEKPPRPSSHQHIDHHNPPGSVSRNTLTNPGSKLEDMWRTLDYTKCKWPVRFFTCYSSIEMDMGINDQGLVDIASGRVFCKFKDIQGIGLAWVANYISVSSTLRHNTHAHQCKKSLCISILLRHSWPDDPKEENRLNFAVCCGALRRSIVRPMLSCMHRQGIVPSGGLTVRRARKFVKKVADNRKLTITFDHRRRTSRLHEEYGLRKHQERYQKLAGSLNEENASSSSSESDPIVQIKKRASRVSKRILKATISKL